jgi:hypothetical protein
VRFSAVSIWRELRKRGAGTRGFKDRSDYRVLERFTDGQGAGREAISVLTLRADSVERYRASTAPEEEKEAIWPNVLASFAMLLVKYLAPDLVRLSASPREKKGDSQKEGLRSSSRRGLYACPQSRRHLSRRHNPRTSPTQRISTFPRSKSNCRAVLLARGS